jgi:hypothetical protein
VKTISGRFIVGLALTVIGASCASVGVVILLAFRLTNGDYGAAEDSAAILSLVFLLIGAGFLIPGLICLVTDVRRKRMRRRVLAQGKPLDTRVTTIDLNPSITYFGRNPYVVFSEYQDENGQVWRFRSENLLRRPDALIRSGMVRVFVDPKNYRNYAFDLDSADSPEGTVSHMARGFVAPDSRLYTLGTVLTAAGGLLEAALVIVALVFSGGDVRWQGLVLLCVICCGPLAVGLCLLLHQVSLRRKVKALKESGKYVTGVIRQLSYDQISLGTAAGTVNVTGLGAVSDAAGVLPGRYYCECTYDAPDGVQHRFRSAGRTGMRADLVGRSVRIYYGTPNFTLYYVDIDSLLEEKNQK